MLCELVSWFEAFISGRKSKMILGHKIRVLDVLGGGVEGPLRRGSPPWLENSVTAMEKSWKPATE